MGVPRLFPWFNTKFYKYIIHFQQGELKSYKADYLYLDANGLLHAAAQEVYHYGDGKRFLNKYENFSEDEKMKAVFSLFFNKILQVTKIVEPKKVLYIAIDGSAPTAKQAQQRERRFVSAKERLESDEGPTFDSNSITPGTVFMHRLTQYMNYAIRNEISKYPQWRKFSVIFSPPTVPGEGEHKIMNYIRDLSETELFDKTHCVFGPDGDLIMLTLGLEVPKIFLLREDQYNPGYYHLLNMGKPRIEIVEELGLIKDINEGKITIWDAIGDFIFLGFMVGNDFLPKLQMFHMLEEGLELMINIYKRLKNEGLIKAFFIGGNLNITDLITFIEEIEKHENSFLVEQLRTTDEKKIPPSPEFVNRTLWNSLREDINEEGDKVFSIDMEKYRIDYYAKEGIKGDNFEEEVRGLCYDYFKGLLWVLSYYNIGLESWSWFYEHHYPPLMFDFLAFMKTISSEEIANVLKFNESTPLLPFEQLLSVLPSSSSNLLAKPYRALMTNNNSPLVKLGYYPNDFKIDYEGKLKAFQGVAILPFVDREEIKKYYKKMTDCCVEDPERYIRNLPGKTATFSYVSDLDATYTSKMGNIKYLKAIKS